MWKKCATIGIPHTPDSVVTTAKWDAKAIAHPQFASCESDWRLAASTPRKVLSPCAAGSALRTTEAKARLAAGAPAEAAHGRGKRRRRHHAADIARHLGDAGHDPESFVLEAQRDQFQERGEHQRIAAGDDQPGGKDVEQVRRQRECGAAERRRRHAEQHHALDAVAVDQKARRNLHQGVAPEITGGEHRHTGGVGGKVRHEILGDRLRRHPLQERDRIGDGDRSPAQIGAIGGADGGRKSGVRFGYRHHTLAKPTENSASAESGIRRDIAASTSEAVPR
jgi:hypothetical protein